jgi:hypothetical protein
LGPVDFFRNGSNKYASYGVMLEDFRGVVRNAGSLDFLKEEAGVRCLVTMQRFANDETHNPRRDTLRKIAVALYMRRKRSPTSLATTPPPRVVAISEVRSKRTRDTRKSPKAKMPAWQKRVGMRRLARRTA